MSCRIGNHAASSFYIYKSVEKGSIHPNRYTQQLTKKPPKDIKCRSERTRNYWKLVLACLTTSSSVSLLVDNCFYSMYSMYGVPYAYQKALRLWYDQSDIFSLFIPNQLILFRFCYMHVFTLKGCIISTRWQLYNLKSRKYIMF